MKDLQPIIEKRIKELKHIQSNIMNHITNLNLINVGVAIDYGKELDMIDIQIAELELILNQ